MLPRLSFQWVLCLFIATILTGCDQYEAAMYQAEQFRKKGDYPRAVHFLQEAQKLKPEKSALISEKYQQYLREVMVKAADCDTSYSTLQSLADSLGNELRQQAFGGRYFVRTIGDKVQMGDLQGKVQFPTDLETATPFDQNGLSRIRSKGAYYLVDTSGQIWPAACQPEALTPDHTAADFRLKGLQVWPRQLGRRPQIKVLLLAENQLKTVPAQHRLSEIEVLDLSYNPVSEFPVSFLESLPKLRMLRLSHTALSPEAIDRIKANVPEGCAVEE